MSGPHRKALETAYPIAYHIQKMSQPGLWPDTFKHCHSYLLYYTHPSVSTYFFYCPAPFAPLVSFIRFLRRRPCRTARFLYPFSPPPPLPTARFLYPFPLPSPLPYRPFPLSVFSAAALAVPPAPYSVFAAAALAVPPVPLSAFSPSEPPCGLPDVIDRSD